DALIRRVGNGLPTQTTENLAQRWEPFRAMIAPHMREWETGLQKVYDAKGITAVNAAIDDLKQTVVGKYVRALEGDGALTPNDPLHALAAARPTIRGVTDDLMRDSIARGELNMQTWRDNYFPHLYEKSGQRLEPRGGSTGFTRQRTYDTIWDALGEGY